MDVVTIWVGAVSWFQLSSDAVYSVCVFIYIYIFALLIMMQIGLWQGIVNFGKTFYENESIQVLNYEWECIHATSWSTLDHRVNGTDPNNSNKNI